MELPLPAWFHGKTLTLPMLEIVAYRFRNNTLEQLAKTSLRRQTFKEGRITIEEAHNHP